MTSAPALTCAALYECDPTFRSGIASWVANRRCPVELADFLREHNLHAAADCADWCATEPDRPVYHSRGPKEQGGSCGPFPTQDNGDNPKFQIWFWFGEFRGFSASVPLRHDDCRYMRDHIRPLEPELAILWLLDNWKPRT